MQNPFKPSDKEDISIQQERAKKELQELSTVTQELMLDKRYMKFAKLYQQAEENIITLFLDLHKLKKIDRYPMYDEYLIELSVYRQMLHTAKDLSNPETAPRVNRTESFKKNMRSLIDRMK